MEKRDIQLRSTSKLAVTMAGYQFVMNFRHMYFKLLAECKGELVSVET